MNLAFYINDLTQLRYYLPLFEAFHAAMPDWGLSAYVEGSNTKYNGLGRRSNRALFEKLMNVRPYVAVRSAGQGHVCDLFFSVECVGLDRFRAGRHVAIQHGADYQSPGRQSTPDTLYLLSSADYAADLETRHGLTGLVPPVPVSLWGIDETTKKAREQLAVMGHRDEPVATVLYPHQGHESIARRVIKHLRRRGYFVVIKQRRKGQRIPWWLRHKVYDDVWYPSESIYFPAVSAVTVGFGSTAYADLVPTGLVYVDLRLPDPQYGLPSYVPVSDRSYHPLEESEAEKVFGLLDSLRPATPTHGDYRSLAVGFIRSELVPRLGARPVS